MIDYYQRNGIEMHIIMKNIYIQGEAGQSMLKAKQTH